MAIRLQNTTYRAEARRRRMSLRPFRRKILRRQKGQIYDRKKVRNSYWRWPERNLAGNAIDFFIQVIGLSFHDTMRQISGA